MKTHNASSYDATKCPPGRALLHVSHPPRLYRSKVFENIWGFIPALSHRPLDNILTTPKYQDYLSFTILYVHVFGDAFSIT